MSDLISIIIPIYKSEQFLKQAIESVLKQTYHNLELILVNDGSPDDSKSICMRFKELDSRVVYIEQSNSGAAHAMLKGVNCSKGDYIMFLDGDDWINHNTLEIAYSFLSSTNVDIVFWNPIKEYPKYSSKVSSFVLNDELFIGERLQWLKRRVFGLIGNELNNITKFDQISSGWGKVYKKQLFDNDMYCLVDRNNVGNFDTELVCRLFYQCSSIQYINEYLNHYRMYNENSITKTHGSKLFYRYKPLFMNLENFIKDNDLNSEFQQALDNRVSVSILNCLLAITSKRNVDGIYKKFASLKAILNDRLYQKSITNFDFRSLNLFYRIFFYLCKIKCTVLILSFGYSLMIIRKISLNNA